MAHYVMIGWDGPEGADRRNKHRDAHVAYVDKLNQKGLVAFAGPIRDEEDRRSVGAVIVYVAESLVEARLLVDADPYVQGGVFQEVTLDPFRLAIPQNP